MQDSMIIYHGSQKIIEKPNFGEGNPLNDYGLGFYCTESVELAKEWACSEKKDGFANQYALNTEDLSILRLTSGDYNILNWLAVLFENRRFRTSGDIALRAKEYIMQNFAVDYKQYDVITGYRADDSYFAFASAFIGNAISLKQLERAMVLGRLGEQVVLKSQKAFEAITFQDVTVAEKEIYFPKKFARDSSAREAFQKEMQVGMVEDGVYILDIIRERWKNDDDRLQRVILR